MLVSVILSNSKSYPSSPVLQQKYSGPCGRLNVTALINSVSGTIRRCGFVEVGVALLEEVRHCGGGL